MIRVSDILSDPEGSVRVALGDELDVLDTAIRLGADVRLVQWDLGFEEGDSYRGAPIHLVGVGLRLGDLFSRRAASPFLGAFGARWGSCHEDYLLWKFEAHAARAVLWRLAAHFHTSVVQGF